MAKRGYNQACNVAGSLDLLGERWTLLIVRELLTGPRRYRDLLDALPGIGTNLLAARLKGLSEEGLVTQRRVPPPTPASVYELTEAGRALEPVLLELVRWGLRYRKPAGKRAFYRPTWVVLAMRGLFRPERARGVTLSCEFRVGKDVFHANVRGGEFESAIGPAAEPDVVVTTEPALFRRFESGASPAALEKTGRWKVKGSRAALKKFSGLFGLPEDPLEAVAAI